MIKTAPLAPSSPAADPSLSAVPPPPPPPDVGGIHTPTRTGVWPPLPRTLLPPTPPALIVGFSTASGKKAGYPTFPLIAKPPSAKEMVAPLPPSAPVGLSFPTGPPEPEGQLSTRFGPGLLRVTVVLPDPPEPLLPGAPPIPPAAIAISNVDAPGVKRVLSKYASA